MVINIFKYTSGTEGQTTKQVLQTLRSYHGKTVYFRPHKDGDWTGGTDNGPWLKDEGDNDALYFIKVIPVALEGVPYSTEKLQVILELESLEYTEVTSLIDSEPTV